MVCLNREGEDRLKEISEANRRKMRHIMLVLRPFAMPVLHPYTHRMDTAMWDNILPHVRTLWMDTIEHWYIMGPQDWRTDAEKRKDWMDYLTQILEYLAKRLSNEANVLVNVDEGDETDEVVQKYLPHGYRPMMRMYRQWRCVRGEWWVEWGNWAWDWDHDMQDYSGCKDPCDYEFDAIYPW